MTACAEWTWRAIVAGLAVLFAANFATADTVVLGASKDNSVIELLFVDPSSNGMGDGMFAGRSGVPHLVRAVMAFDVSVIPPGATVTAVSLKLHMTQAAQLGEPQTAQTLHRLVANWGEGASVAFGGTGTPALPGDVTWLHTFYPDQFWTTEGGDFDPLASASTTVGTTTPGAPPVPYTWSSQRMIADVQAWVNNSPGNFGWMLRGDEINDYTSRRYATREYLDPAARPQLTIEFTPPVQCAGDLNHDQMVNVQDMLAVINAWGACPQCPPSCIPDITGDCLINVQDLLAVINAWGACN